jgi:hypothetical protein
MPVLAVALATPPAHGSSAHPWVEKALRIAFPTSNPDFEHLYPLVHLWWVEVNDSGIPQRELGFSQGNVLVLAGPLGSNMGFWTDSPMVFKPSEHEAVAQAAFERHWSEFESQWWASHAQKRDA